MINIYTRPSRDAVGYYQLNVLVTQIVTNTTLPETEFNLTQEGSVQPNLNATNMITVSCFI